MIISVFLTACFLVFGILVAFIGTPLMAVAWLIDPSKRVIHFLERWYLSTLSMIIGIRIKLEGKENINRKQAYLIISNHKSAMDILVLKRALPIRFKFFAASFLFKIPFFGWCMSLIGHLPIDRSNRVQALRFIKKGTRLLEEGKSSILIFPEGTRTMEAEIKPFKLGFLRITSDIHPFILPVVLDGTEKIKRKDNFWYHPGRVRMSILPAVSTENIDQSNWDEHKQKFEDMIRQEYDRIHANDHLS
jgi:1-acyl-sn-glycerol-3-phosphate acyltransferase